MPTYIKLADGDGLTVEQDYREVYEKLLAAAWREPCEFTQHEDEHTRPVTLNPAYVVFLRGA